MYIEADSYLAAEEIFHLLWNLYFHRSPPKIVCVIHLCGWKFWPLAPAQNWRIILLPACDCSLNIFVATVYICSTPLSAA